MYLFQCIHNHQAEKEPQPIDITQVAAARACPNGQFASKLTLVASQLDRRVTRDRMLLCAKELDSARRRHDRATRTAEEAERFKAQFMANVGHEVRTPMNAILGFSRLLMKEGLSAQQKEKLQYVHDAGNALSRLIDNILDFSKLARGELGLHSRAFNLDTVLQDVLGAARTAAQEKGLSIHCHVPQSIPRRLHGDRIRFRQILSICERLVDLMGGQIGFRSTPDEGSSFWFTAVFVKETQRERLSRGATPSVSTATSPVDSSCGTNGDGPRRGAAKYRVLAVGDNSLERTLIEALLIRAGCIVDLAADAKEALATLTNSPYDLALMNVDMRDVDVVEAVQRFRREEIARMRRTAIVVLTDKVTDDEQAACSKAGADGLLVKPLAPEALFQAIGRLLPGFLESIEEKPAQWDTASNDATGQSETLPNRITALRSALDARDFRHLEDQARALGSAAARSGSKIVADHAMRIQFAARGTHPSRASAAIDRLEETLRTEIDPEEQTEKLLETCPWTGNQSCPGSSDDDTTTLSRNAETF